MTIPIPLFVTDGIILNNWNNWNNRAMAEIALFVKRPSWDFAIITPSKRSTHKESIMKLKREAIKLGNEYNGKWNFVIMDKDAEKIEAVEDALCDMDTGFSLGGVEKTWGDYCDQCPCYEDGYGSGFWIEIEDVPAFKEAFKAAKKSIK